MRAAWYDKQGPAKEVLVVGEMADPEPGTGEVRIRVAASGINPGDVKKRRNEYGIGMPFPRVIPHSDGAGIIDQIGEGVAAARVGERVWCYGAQSYRPFGTAGEYVLVPSAQAVGLPNGVTFEQGACLGIPGITAHRAVHIAGPVAGRTVMVQGGAGAVGLCAVVLAKLARAHVIATVRSERASATVVRAGADDVIRTDGIPHEDVVRRIRRLAPNGVDHIVEVAFDANLTVDIAVLAGYGSIAAYATSGPSPTIPFWPLVFKNVRVFFLGSDDFPAEAKAMAVRDLNAAFNDGWRGFEGIRQFNLSDIASAHDCVEERKAQERVVVKP